jgi:hypothetical protein
VLSVGIKFKLHLTYAVVLTIGCSVHHVKGVGAAIGVGRQPGQISKSCPAVCATAVEDAAAVAVGGSSNSERQPWAAVAASQGASAVAAVSSSSGGVRKAQKLLKADNVWNSGEGLTNSTHSNLPISKRCKGKRI